MTRELISKKTGTVFLIRLSLLRIMVLPAPRIREKPIQPTEMQGVFCWDVMALSLQRGPNHPAIPQIAGRDGLASDFGSWLPYSNCPTPCRAQTHTWRYPCLSPALLGWQESALQPSFRPNSVALIEFRSRVRKSLCQLNARAGLAVLQG